MKNRIVSSVWVLMAMMFGSVQVQAHGGGALSLCKSDVAQYDKVTKDFTDAQFALHDFLVAHGDSAGAAKYRAGVPSFKEKNCSAGSGTASMSECSQGYVWDSAKHKCVLHQ